MLNWIGLGWLLKLIINIFFHLKNSLHTDWLTDTNNLYLIFVELFPRQADTVGDAYVAVTGLPTYGAKATSESVTNIAHLALEMLGQLNNLDHENESMCEVCLLIRVYKS